MDKIKYDSLRGHPRVKSGHAGETTSPTGQRITWRPGTKTLGLLLLAATKIVGLMDETIASSVFVEPSDELQQKG